MKTFLKIAAVAAVVIAGASAAQAGGYARAGGGAVGNWDVQTLGYGSGMGEAHTYSGSSQSEFAEGYISKTVKGTSKYHSFRGAIGLAHGESANNMSGSFGGVMTNGYAAGSAWGGSESFSEAGR